MLYSHDSYGLGHLRRTLALSRYLRSGSRGLSQLIVTGSPFAHALVLPDDADYMKLPAAVKVGPDEYRARSLPLELRELRDLRADLVLAAARHLRPDALLVDHTPAGLRGEIVPTLRFLKEERPWVRLVLGLRDVVDAAPRVRQAWTREGVYELLDDIYDAILAYGDEDVYDVAREYALSPQAAAKVRYVGYIGTRPGVRKAEHVRAELGLGDGPLVLVTAGGGGDGYELLEAAVGAAETARERSLNWLFVTGPLMPAAERDRLLERVPPDASIRFVSFVDDLPGYIAAADAVVSMGGYNSVCEILSTATPGLIVPRVTPRDEQLIRAELLSERGLVRMLHPAELTPRRLLREVMRLLTCPAAGTPVCLDGLDVAAAELDATFAEVRRPAHAHA